MTLSARDLTVIRRDRAILDTVSVDIAPGELIVVVGPNGAGKSTLLGSLAGDLAPDRGSVSLDGEDLAGITLARRARLRAVVGAPPRLAFNFSVRDIVAMGWQYGNRLGQDALHDAVQQILLDCDLRHLADRTFASLSSGEQQRAQFARARLQLWRPAQEHGPRWMLLDEPNANLDVAHGLGLLESLRALARTGVGVLAILHDLNLAARFADRVLLLESGRCVGEGPAAEVMDSPTLSAVYRTPIHVEHHAALDRLVVLA